MSAMSPTFHSREVFERTEITPANGNEVLKMLIGDGTVQKEGTGYGITEKGINVVKKYVLEDAELNVSRSSDRNFEWFKYWEFAPEIIQDFDINLLRKSVAPKATSDDWNYIKMCLNSRAAIFEKEKIAIPYEIANQIVGGLRTLTKFKDDFNFDLVQINGKSFKDSEITKQYLLISTVLYMIALDDFSPLETANNYYDVLHEVLSRYNGRQTVTEKEFVSAVSDQVKLIWELPVRNQIIRELTIVGLLEQQVDPQDNIVFHLDFSPGRYDFNEWLTQLFEYKLRIRNSETLPQEITDDKPLVDKNSSKGQIPLDRLSLSIKNVLCIAETLRKTAIKHNKYISTRLLFSAAIISAEQNHQRNSARVFLDYLEEDHKSKTGINITIPAPDLMKLEQRYGIAHRRFKPAQIEEININLLSSGTKLALAIALNEYSNPTLNPSKTELRHILAALLFANKPEHRMGVQKFIYDELVINIDGLKNIFLDYINAAYPNEFKAWKRIIEAQFPYLPNDQNNEGLQKEINKKETVPIHHDDPTTDDKLQRRVLAEALYRRIEEIRRNSQKNKRGSFLVHLSGAWGSGKTSFVSFLEDCFKRNKIKKSWIVVEFNAWQHQRLVPPWWYLINLIFKTALKEKIKNCKTHQLVGMF